MFVSRETFSSEAQARLKGLERLMNEWSLHSSLVSRADEARLASRHVDDSLVIVPLVREFKSVADVGSGNGFPGLVLAACGVQVDLIERSEKKCAFLRYAIAELDLTATVHCADITKISGSFDALTARAVAPLSQLIRLLSRHLKVGVPLFAQKGERWREEWSGVADKENWSVVPIVQSSVGAVLKILRQESRGFALGVVSHAE